MYKLVTHIFIPLALLSSVGCSTNTGTGALVGAGGGAIAGGVIGGPTGALIGAGAGAVGGAIIGNLIDQEQARKLKKKNPDTYSRLEKGEPLRAQDVVALQNAGVDDHNLIKIMDKSGTICKGNFKDQLKQGNVNKKVVTAFKNNCR